MIHDPVRSGCLGRPLKKARKTASFRQAARDSCDADNTTSIRGLLRKVYGLGESKNVPIWVRMLKPGAARTERPKGATGRRPPLWED